MAEYDETIGYMVLTNDKDGGWHADWDGEIHPIDRAIEEFEKAGGPEWALVVRLSTDV